MWVAIYFCLLPEKRGNYFRDLILDTNNKLKHMKQEYFPNDHKWMGFSGVAIVRRYLDRCYLYVNNVLPDSIKLCLDRHLVPCAGKKASSLPKAGKSINLDGWITNSAKFSPHVKLVHLELHGDLGVGWILKEKRRYQLFSNPCSFIPLEYHPLVLRLELQSLVCAGLSIRAVGVFSI